MKTKYMKIVAYLQNMWVKDPDKVRVMIERRPDQWNWYCKAFLFSGCITGKRIKRVFGEQLSNQIIWDECTKEIAGDAKKICKPNEKHIKESLLRLKPNIVIAFGKIAHKAVSKFPMYYDTLIESPHPAARQPDTLDKLKLVANILKEKLI